MFGELKINLRLFLPIHKWSNLVQIETCECIDTLTIEAEYVQNNIDTQLRKYCSLVDKLACSNLSTQIQLRPKTRSYLFGDESKLTFIPHTKTTMNSLSNNLNMESKLMQEKRHETLEETSMNGI